jgi:AraC-like DNA-binding protein
VAFVGEEARTAKPGKDVVLAHLLEVMLIEALRSAASVGASPGLLRGLADDRLAAIRRMHEAPGRGWSVAELAREAALSRSAFFERFGREVGVAPMEYLLTWRMALAKGLLQRGGGAVGSHSAWAAGEDGYSNRPGFSRRISRRFLSSSTPSSVKAMMASSPIP